MLNLTSYQAYNTIFSSTKSMPSAGTSGYANLAGAYLTAKYGNALTKNINSNMSGFVSSFRNATAALNKSSKSLTASASTTQLGDEKSAAYGTSELKKSEPFSIQIDRLATKQINQSSTLNAKQDTAMTSGKKTMTLESGKSSFSFSIDVADGDSNETVMKKTAAAINGLGAGVNAKVTSDSLGNSQLQIESKNTGKENSFSTSGALSDELGLSNTTQDAEDSKFTYDGKDFETGSNDVALDNGKTKLTLKSTTSGAVPLDKSAYTKNMKDDVKSMVEAYNSLKEKLESEDSGNALKAVGKQLDRIISDKADSLEQFGVEKDSKGYLKIDQKKLEQQIADKPDEAKALFSGSSGLSEKLKNRTDQLLKSPASDLISSKASFNPAPYMARNSNFVAQLTGSQSSGNLFDMFL